MASPANGNGRTKSVREALDETVVSLRAALRTLEDAADRAAAAARKDASLLASDVRRSAAEVRRRAGPAVQRAWSSARKGAAKTAAAARKLVDRPPRRGEQSGRDPE